MEESGARPDTGALPSPAPMILCADLHITGQAMVDAPRHAASRVPDGSRGVTLLELLLALGLSAAIASMAIPLTSAVLDEMRTAMAARYVEGRIYNARMQAIRRSARVALRFEAQEDDYTFAEYADGNGNGVRTMEIGAGIDPEIVPAQALRDSFTGVAFGLLGGTPDVEGVRSAEHLDGVRIGTSRILTLGPDGTATSGTLYLHGRRSQYAIRARRDRPDTAAALRYREPTVDLQVADRRAERRVPAALVRVDRATLRPGFPVRVVDLSPGGVQVQSDRPLRPGRRVHVHLVTPHRTLALPALILRCVVWAVEPEAGVIYRGGLRFEQPCDPLTADRATAIKARTPP